MKMSRSSYRKAISWIALNDDVLETDLEVVAMQISTVLVADLFGIDAKCVASAVLAQRERIATALGEKNA